MMWVNKKIALLILASACFKVDLLSQKIDSIVIYSLPWNFNIEGQITDSLLRKGELPYFHKLVVGDSSSITDFITAISILNFRPYESCKESFSPRVAIDVHFDQSLNLISNGGQKRPPKIISLNSRKLACIEGELYFRNLELLAWLAKMLPEKR